MIDIPKIWNIDLASKDPDRLAELVGSIYAPVVVDFVRDERIIDLNSNIVACKDFAIAKTNYASGVYYRPLTEAQFVLAVVPLSGDMRLYSSSSDDSFSPNDIVISNAENLKGLTYASGRSDVSYMMGSETLKKEMEILTGVRCLSLAPFCLNINRSTSIGAFFYSFSFFVSDLLSNSNSLLSSPIQIVRLRDMLVSILLTLVDVNILENTGKRLPDNSIRDVERAEEFMYHHAKEAISVRDVAIHLGLSLRSVQYAFKKHRGVGPLATLNRLRLEGFRRELLAGSAQTISELAVSWGFVHAGRLSMIYRSTFGETPRETLKRARSKL